MDIYLMDHKRNQFFKEQVQGVRFPIKFSTLQTSDGCIYMIGGYRMGQ